MLQFEFVYLVSVCVSLIWPILFIVILCSFGSVAYFAFEIYGKPVTNFYACIFTNRGYHHAHTCTTRIHIIYISNWTKRNESGPQKYAKILRKSFQKYLQSFFHGTLLTKFNIFINSIFFSLPLLRFAFFFALSHECVLFSFDFILFCWVVSVSTDVIIYCLFLLAGVYAYLCVCLLFLFLSIRTCIHLQWLMFILVFGGQEGGREQKNVYIFFLRPFNKKVLTDFCFVVFANGNAKQSKQWHLRFTHMHTHNDFPFWNFNPQLHSLEPIYVCVLFAIVSPLRFFSFIFFWFSIPR